MKTRAAPSDTGTDIRRSLDVSDPQGIEGPRLGGDEGADIDPALLRDVAAWVSHVVRTLKTCRLYDPNNPTVVKFRESAYADLRALVDRYGPLRLDITSREVLLETRVVHAGRSREDSFAATFHRDGIRAVTFLPGIEPREMEAFLDHLLHVSGPGAGDDDLVTLLWDANLPSISVASVPVEGDVDGAGDEGGDDTTALPWPGAGRGSGAVATPDAAARPREEGADEGPTRSDDWEVLARPGGMERAYTGLEAAAEREAARFAAELESETTLLLVEATVDVIADALATDATAADRADLVAFLPRVLREAIALGEWPTAHKALHLIRRADPDWSLDSFFDGLVAHAGPVTRKAVQALDQQDDDGVAGFLAFAGELGPAAAEWLMHVLALSQQKRARRPLTRAIAELVRGNPERLLPWLSDDRWFVVRNVVHILGWIGGDAVAGYLRTASQHPEMRVRREVVAALGEASPDVARPMLLSMLGTAEPRLFPAVLHPLAADHHPEVAERLAALLRDEGFVSRSDDERRAVYLAVAAHGDAMIEALEDELQRGGRFARGLDAHWQSVARCIGRIGTPEARAALGRGLRSPRAGVRKACELALAALESRDAA